MLKRLTTMLSIFVLVLSFVFPSVSIAEDHMQLYVSPPTKNQVEAKKAELQSVSIAEDYIQLYVNPPINNKVSNYIPKKRLPFGTTADSGMYYDFYFHYQNPKGPPEKPITGSDLVQWLRSFFEYPG